MTRYPSYVMDFDHRDPEIKNRTVSALPRLNSWKKLLEETAKCDVVCANCHRVCTFQRG